jgi:TrmH family RNA methyltransferase
MTSDSSLQRISSRDNPLVARLRKLAQDNGAYRRAAEVWLEGEHLCSALRQRGGAATLAVVVEEAWDRDAAVRELADWAPRVALVPASLFKSISGLESPAKLGFVMSLQTGQQLQPDLATVVLDRVQDAGNVGSILRSASAFGFQQVLAIKGTAGLWSPKVLRAGMGAHFALRLVEGLDEADLSDLKLPLVATSSHGGMSLPEAKLPRPCAWVLGHEGQGVSERLLERCALKVCIPQPGGEESLNVAAAAAICLYASSR